MKRSSKLKKILYWIPALLIMLIIFYFSSRTGTESNSQSDPIVLSILDFFHLNENIRLFITFLVRKAGHISEYLLLSFFIFYGIKNTLNGSDLKEAVITFLLSYLYAVSDEVHQLFVLGRSGRFTDTLIDSIGIILGILLFLGIKKWLIQISHRC